MKTLIALIISGLLSIGSFAQQLTTVQLESRTRGGHKSIQVTEDSVFFEMNRHVSKGVVSQNEWNELVGLAKDINFKQIQGYINVSPDNRTRDAAWHSKLSLSTNTNTYTSTDFDDVQAPNELMPLVQFLLRLDKKHNPDDGRLY